VYARRLRASLKGAELPRHVGLIMDGNRRWARQMGMTNPSLGHKFGADHVEDVLSWCDAPNPQVDVAQRERLIVAWVDGHAAGRSTSSARTATPPYRPT